MKSKEYKKFEQLVQRMDPQSKLFRTWELKGGVSAQVTALEMMRPDGQTKKVIVRRHGEVDLKQKPHVAAYEFKLLKMLKSEGLPTPTPCHLDSSGKIFSTPTLVIEFIEGQTEFAPVHFPDYMRQLTTHLTNIHRVDVSKVDVSFLPSQEEIVAEMMAKRPEYVDESSDEGRIRDILESRPLPQRNQSVLLHGDFWPGNTLWKKGRLVAVIDWEDAVFGDPLADVANGRLEILWAFGVDAMNDFTQQYQFRMTTIDFANLPYWDLFVALRSASKISEWGLDESTERKMREKHQLFVNQAIEKLNVR
ncbi:aminoglycoside phosphotransferase (APT) family kinase protein [Melghirimyces profundicolus]|uniref:Aminoglycoside phosphotransferase (APT) family kinase protein n=1 Tax=Melghirimyces profundicolus TaxID=1242148 RepID=A0A2T6B787_9BACL|nr:phosphotransferase [Melghirimyces profundicolus]PTX51924.1 aminoglycoside phosphotransferase (APT) family kinase protein [Melghirimyces profundicolus]